MTDEVLKLERAAVDAEVVYFQAIGRLAEARSGTIAWAEALEACWSARQAHERAEARAARARAARNGRRWLRVA